MAHELDFTTGRAGMAFVGATPWHGLGQQLLPDADIDTWRIQAGMDWDLVSSPVLFNGADGEIRSFDKKRVLSRSDSGDPLSVVSNAYNVVQPRDVLDFYASLVGDIGFKLHTAGVLLGGKKYWALAETGRDFRLKGQDQVAAFLLLATACDGTLATRAMFTSVRVVCANTLGFAVNGNSAGQVRVPHSAVFRPDEVKAQLGLIDTAFPEFEKSAEALADIGMSNRDAIEFLVRVFGDESLPIAEQSVSNARVMQSVFTLYDSAGRGSDLKSAKGTAWGLLNAATEFVDHHKGRSQNTRLDSAWFGEGAVIKRKAWDEALLLVKKAA